MLMAIIVLEEGKQLLNLFKVAKCLGSKNFKAFIGLNFFQSNVKASKAATISVTGSIRNSINIWPSNMRAQKKRPIA
jgi:hypothetical protein